MQFPAMIAFEYSDHDIDGFPTAIAWTLESALYKAALIQPDDQWLATMKDDSTALERPVSELLEMGENLADVIQELTTDCPNGPLMAEDPEMAQAMLEQLFSAAGHDNPYQVEPIVSLFGPWPPEDIDRTRRLYLDRLDLSPHIAEQNILLWRATYAHLMQEAQIMTSDDEPDGEPTSPSPRE